MKRRLDVDGMSYTEFSYLLLQSNDYLQLNRSTAAALQVGGSDQWGNIVGGVDLIRRVEGRHVHALTAPLVTDAEGRKFGKSTGGGNVWLDPEMTSPYAWYQYFVNVGDADVLRYLRLFTFLTREEIDELEKETAEKPAPAVRAEAARRRSSPTWCTVSTPRSRSSPRAGALFGRGELRDLDAATLDAAMAEVPTGTVRLADEPTIVDLLVASGPRREPGCRAARGEGGRCLREQREDRRRGVEAGEGRPAARQVARGAPGQAQQRGHPRGALTCRFSASKAVGPTWDRRPSALPDVTAATLCTGWGLR